MSVLILGAQGSMGKRYQAILKFLGKDFIGLDKGFCPIEFNKYTKACSGIIIATPTDTHFDFLLKVAALKKPVLCEKPLSKDPDTYPLIREMVRSGLNLTMTAQYKILDGYAPKAYTSYDFFRHGNDGLYWDCIQPIGLARWRVRIREESPVWKCTLNGKRLGLGQMDQAYVEFVKRWFWKPGDDFERVIDMHVKVLEFKNA